MNAGLTNSLVLGLGESGLAMALWLHRQGRAVRVADSREDPPGVAELKQHVPDAECICGPFSFSLLKDIDQLAISPGLSVDTPIVQEALKRGIDIVGEIELFARALPSVYPRPCHAIQSADTTRPKCPPPQPSPAPPTHY